MHSQYESSVTEHFGETLCEVVSEGSILENLSWLFYQRFNRSGNQTF